MGTHPIFESDFDCLTEKQKMVQIQEIIEPEPEKVETPKAEAKLANVTIIEKPKRKTKFTLLLDNVDPNAKATSVAEKELTQDEAKRAALLIAELNDNEKAKNYPRMTKQALRDICKKQKLYLTPYLNDQLYLHFKGWWRIENLDEYTGLRCLWLESNGIRRLENLANQSILRCLYIQNNLIERIENLASCKMLAVLNLESNRIKKLANLSCLESLETLHIGKNQLSDYESLEHLIELKKLSVLSLNNNRIEDPSCVSIFYQMAELRVLNLMGNPICGKVRYYRKTLTVNIAQLSYLDDRPVFPRDRALAEAWMKGGHEAEAAERTKWANKDRLKIESSIYYLRELKEKAEAKRRAAQAEAGEVCDEEEMSQSDDNEVIPLNQVKMDQGDDENVPILEKVDLPAEVLMPKGYRKVEIEMDEGDDEDPFGENDNDEIELDDLPDLEQPAATPNTLEPTTTTAKSGLFSIVEPAKPDPISELLFTKVDSQSLDQAAQSSKPKKMLIEEIE